MYFRLPPRLMDPFQEYTVKLYNQFITSSDLTVKCDIKWSLLACEMVLKDKSIDSSIHLRVLNYLLELVKTEPVLSDNDCIFIIDCIRKGVKRTGTSEVIKELLELEFINISRTVLDDELLKLVLTCKDYGISSNDELVEELYELYSHEGILELDFDEFHFIETEKSFDYRKQRRQRLLLLFDPLKGLQMFPDVKDDYWFALLSISDSELISFMKRLLLADQNRFLQFYNHVIKEDLLSVDFFIDQLLTDSIELLELLLAIFELKPLRGISTYKHFKNFHILLLLKLEISSDSFPFDCKILLKKLEKFMKK